ncbi:hypothetical protein BDR26DRAFT_900485 [Obelidium mucronatum]|nr:hypothetical protein BDR26DRAFT_900485 [Obelidium mucronatum]
MRTITIAPIAAASAAVTGAAVPIGAPAFPTAATVATTVASVTTAATVHKRSSPRVLQDIGVLQIHFARLLPRQLRLHNHCRCNLSTDRYRSRSRQQEENMSPEWKPRFKRIAPGTDLHTTVVKVCSRSYSDSKDNIAEKLFGKYGKGARMTAEQNLPLKRFAEYLFSSSSLAKLNRAGGAALLRKIRHFEQFQDNRVGFWKEAHAEINRVNGLEPEYLAQTCS